MIWQALVELYEYLLKFSCDMAQEAPPQRKSCVLSKPLPLPRICMSGIILHDAPTVPTATISSVYTLQG